LVGISIENLENLFGEFLQNGENLEYLSFGWKSIGTNY
jgi:hypothetical protein